MTSRISIAEYKANCAGSSGSKTGRVVPVPVMPTVLLPYPPSANRMWKSFGGRMVLSAEAANFKGNAAKLARAAGIPLVDGPVIVVITLHPRSNKDGSASKTCLDLDNPIKPVLDALQGVAYTNDKQVRRLSVAYGNPMKGGGLTVAVMDANDMKAMVQ
jgi:crossover junction endodeoxyribonuclease RusA